MPRSVLYVAQLSPPAPLSAARRTAGMTKYLGRLGHRVTLLTSLASGRGGVEGAARVVKTRDLMVSRLNWRRAHFEALKGEGGGGGYGGASRLASLVVPDLALVGWIPFALPRAFALASRERVQCVITSSPSPSTHLVGMALGARGIPWIADFRDGWTFEPVQAEWPLPGQDRLDRALERAVVERADSVVAVTRPIAEDFAARFGVDPVVITNGFDPEERPSIPDAGATELLSPERHSLVHTGRMAAAGRSPATLLEALRLLARDSPRVAERFELVLAGPLTEEERALIAGPGLEGMIRGVGSLGRARVLGLQRSADSLLVLAASFSLKSVATGKLYEYLAAGRPILVVGEESEAARIVAEVGAGFAAPVDDPDAIADALRTLVDGAPEPSAEGLERFAYPQLARRMAEQIESVCG
jgi:glycosyltransferase involved in cell wall biosynthesis